MLNKLQRHTLLFISCISALRLCFYSTIFSLRHLLSNDSELFPGYMMSHSLSSTDITKHADRKGYETFYAAFFYIFCAHSEKIKYIQILFWFQFHSTVSV